METDQCFPHRVIDSNAKSIVHHKTFKLSSQDTDVTRLRTKKLPSFTRNKCIRQTLIQFCLCSGSVFCIFFIFLSVELTQIMPGDEQTKSCNWIGRWRDVSPARDGTNVYLIVRAAALLFPACIFPEPISYAAQKKICFIPGLVFYAATACHNVDDSIRG